MHISILIFLRTRLSEKILIILGQQHYKTVQILDSNKKYNLLSEKVKDIVQITLMDMYYMKVIKWDGKTRNHVLDVFVEFFDMCDPSDLNEVEEFLKNYEE